MVTFNAGSVVCANLYNICGARPGCACKMHDNAIGQAQHEERTAADGSHPLGSYATSPLSTWAKRIAWPSFIPT